MYTFITIVTTPCDKAVGKEQFSVDRGTFTVSRKETVIAKIERRALTAQQAEAQALANTDFIVRDGFGQVITDAELNFTTIRKFAIEVGK
jgi:hypothetical protein